ncbi:hypothetical protein [Nocardioides baculatus]|uniref:Secreted protein n=1 Tax=Nocardioides baculatus TaxID=2801337 RepID=A0ABS1L855_9ACTN|nr:hypothetical protein [Nocardioides baculatus]MBL0747850.1 hypothetical protein [Nocardioides baculatus]
MRRTLSIIVLVAALLPAASAGAATESVRTVTYRGFGATVTLDHLDRISRTSQPFQDFVERRLTRLWQDNDPRPRCRTAATMIVKTWRSDGYALISDMGNFAPCPGGGYVQIAVRTDTGWRTPTRLGAQEPFRCRVLGRYDVPASVVPDGKCFAGEELVAYDDWRADH